MTETVKLDDEKKGPEQVVEDLRAAMVAAIESTPTAFIIFYESGTEGNERIACRAVGSPVSLIALCQAGTDQLAEMLRRALHPSNKNG